MAISSARLLTLVVLSATACGDDGSTSPDGGGAGDAQGDGGGGDGSIDAPDVIHTGGWRPAAHDPTRAGRLEVAGPSASATLGLVYETPVNDADLGVPVIDEDGNLYTTEYRPGAGYELISLSAAGALRWHVPIPASFLTQLSLGPDGKLYALDTVPGMGDDARIVVHDTADGSVLDFSPPIVGHQNFDVNLTVSSDGKIILRSNTTNDGYRLRTYRTVDDPSWSAAVGGNGASGFGGYARSPDGATIVVPTTSGTGPPFTVRALDAETGTERWNYPLDATLLSPVLAVGADGAVYIAASQTTSNLHVIKLSSTGQFAWDHTEATVRTPYRILVGAQSVVVGAGQLEFGGIILTTAGVKQTGTFFSGGNCRPQVIDTNDVAYWACAGNVSASNPAGDKLHDWRRTNNEEVGFDMVAGPSGALYTIFTPQNFKPQIYRVQ